MRSLLNFVAARVRANQVIPPPTCRINDNGWLMQLYKISHSLIHCASTTALPDLLSRHPTYLSRWLKTVQPTLQRAFRLWLKTTPRTDQITSGHLIYRLGKTSLSQLVQSLLSEDHQVECEPHRLPASAASNRKHTQNKHIFWQFLEKPLTSLRGHLVYLFRLFLTGTGWLLGIEKRLRRALIPSG